MRAKAIIGLLLVLFLGACQKQTIELSFETIESYFPIKKGTTLTYRLDSTSYSGVNNAKSINSYFIRDVLDTNIIDNLGKPTFIYKRSIRSKLDTTKWDLQFTYRVSIDSSKLYITENNLRFIKMVSPIKEGFTWNGNSFINTNENTGLAYYENWDYTYGKPSEPLIINNIPFTATLTVFQKNDTIGNVSDRKQYSSILFSKEVYAKETGLVYKEFFKETWQPPNSNNPNGYFEKDSYGIKLTIVSFK
ncbi:MAG: hypothetical protein RLZZ520_492 [Bacteroidota bacterium]|jgi:hypothetical protein